MFIIEMKEDLEIDFEEIMHKWWWSRDNEDYNLDDVLYILGNPQKRDISVRISSMQFLRDRELGIHSKKQKLSESFWSLFAR